MPPVAPRPSFAIALAFATVIATAGLVLLALTSASAAGAEESAAEVRRVVSLNPSLTAIALALGAADVLVGVDDYSARLEPRVAKLPRVGGLHSPNLEAVVALEPDVVVLVPSVAQRDFRQRLEALGVRVESFENTRFDQVLENVERLGRMLGQTSRAEERIDAIVGARRRAGEVGLEGGAPKVALVIQRDPLYVVGGESFMAEMLAMLGARSIGDAFSEPYPRVDVEWLVAQAPDIVIDMTEDATPAEAHWARFPSLPAVSKGRVHALEPGLVSLPGPDLDRALAALAGALYGEAAARVVAGDAAS